MGRIDFRKVQLRITFEKNIIWLLAAIYTGKIKTNTENIPGPLIYPAALTLQDQIKQLWLPKTEAPAILYM